MIVKAIITILIWLSSHFLYSQGLTISISENQELQFLQNGQPLPLMLKLSTGIEIYAVKERVKYNYASFKVKETRKHSNGKMSLHRIISYDPKFLDINLFNGSDSARLQVSVNDNHEVRFYIKPYSKNFNRIKLVLNHTPHQQIWGLGLQGSYVNHFGKKPLVLVEEQGIGRGDQPQTFILNLIAGVGGHHYSSYYPKPFYISENLYSFELINFSPVRFDFSKKEKTTISIWDGNTEIAIRFGTDVKNLISLHTEKNGRFRQLPDWAYGTWLGIQGGWDVVLSRLNDVVKAGNPVSALWIQDWCGRRKTRLGSQLFWNWQLDSISYYNFRSKVDSLNLAGIKVLGYINPFIANVGPLMQEAIEKNFLVKNQKGENYLVNTGGFPAYMLDLSNPNAQMWIKNIIKTNMIDLGLSGWMADFAEWLPFDAVMNDGRSGRDWHNVYPVMWAALNRQAIREAGKEDEIVFFNRSGYNKSDEFATLFWMGDQMVNWGKNDGIRSVVNLTLSGTLSGIALNHSDIGGYTTISQPIIRAVRKSKLLSRWSELNVFAPVFRTHEGIKPNLNIQVYSNPKEIINFATYGKLHYSLKPYLKELVAEASKTGIAPLRPMFLEFPDDEKCKNNFSQLMLGSDLIFAPVLRKNSKRVKIYLPKGEWIHYYSQTTYQGEQTYKIAAPVGRPAFFIKKNTQLQKLMNLN